jgi:hypothetical protein
MITTTTGVTQIPVTRNGKEQHRYNVEVNGVDTSSLHTAINGIVELPPS